ncbi:MAG: FKBP-type peptidyl-prolyl cis-trans isomerase [Bdellovibrionia bacterium]
MNRRSVTFLSILSLLFVIGCTKSCSGGGGGGAAAQAECKPSTEAVTELQKIDLKTGDGLEAATGKSVKVHYTGTFMDCKKFDSSLDRGQPFEFQLGAGMVIPGWDQGVAGMKVGGKRILLVPFQLGYGEAGHPGGIPPKSDLRFEVELLGVQ